MSDACRFLHERLAQLTRLGADHSPSDVPLNGVYVMFERGERAHGTDRIVRVGTHSGGGNLRQRLAAQPNRPSFLRRVHDACAQAPLSSVTGNRPHLSAFILAVKHVPERLQRHCQTKLA